jgi:hypothetical protein
MTPPSPTEAELHFYYFGFYRALRRYRRMTLIGWSVVLTGCASVPLGWNAGRTGELIDLALSACTILAGLALVWLSVTSLDDYVKIPYSSRHPGNGDGEPPVVLGEIMAIMQDVADGGWQEAYAGLSTLKEIGARHGLPALE